MTSKPPIDITDGAEIACIDMPKRVGETHLKFNERDVEIWVAGDGVYREESVSIPREDFDMLVRWYTTGKYRKGKKS